MRTGAGTRLPIAIFCVYYAQMASRINSPLQARALGERLRSERLARRLSLQNLGKITGVHHSQISRFERGSAVTFSANLQKICKELKIGLTPKKTGEQMPLGHRVEALLRASPSSEVAVDALVSALERVVSESAGFSALR